jgi:hypothetical protein
MEEITTPLPKASYDDVSTRHAVELTRQAESLNDNTTLRDFFDLTKDLPVAGESELSVFIKSQSLSYRACRYVPYTLPDAINVISLFDQSPSTATRDATEHLLAVAERHLASMPVLPYNTNMSPEVAIQYGNLSHCWMMLYT